jgi:hypothetical protein
MDALADAIAAEEITRPEPARTPAPHADKPSWASAEPTDAQRPVPMPSGYGPRRGRTTP